MPEWSQRAKIHEDVVYFPYTPQMQVKKYDEVYLWDLDKTYLDTKFETLKGLFQTFFEKAFQKENVPGTATLCSSLKAHWHEHFGRTPFPIFFITASPPQLEKKIVKKLYFDGVAPKGLFCKDNFKNLRLTRLWRLTQQVGYKLQALMQLRLQLSENVRQIMWGDDSESDVIIYCLYSDICSRRLEREELIKILKALGVAGTQLDVILEMQTRVPKQDPVEKIYINLAEDTDAEYYIKFGRRCLPTYNSFQTALDLFQDGRLKVDDVVKVAEDMVSNFGLSMDQLGGGLDDLIRRKVIGAESVESVLPQLQEKHLIHPQFELSLEPKKIKIDDERRVELEGNFESWVPEHIDYLNDYR